MMPPGSLTGAFGFRVCNIGRYWSVGLTICGRASIADGYLIYSRDGLNQSAIERVRKELEAAEALGERRPAEILERGANS